jgi:hypothetical protein
VGWQLVEVGLVTTLSIWVFLFSPSPNSRLVAAVVFCINLLWVILEREGPRRPATPPRSGEEHQLTENTPFVAPPESAATLEPPTPTPPLPPGPKRVI